MRPAHIMNAFWMRSLSIINRKKICKVKKNISKDSFKICKWVTTNSVVRAEDYYQFEKYCHLWSAWAKWIQKLDQHDMAMMAVQ